MKYKSDEGFQRSPKESSTSIRRDYDLLPLSFILWVQNGRKVCVDRATLHFFGTASIKIASDFLND